MVTPEVRNRKRPGPVAGRAETERTAAGSGVAVDGILHVDGATLDSTLFKSLSRAWEYRGCNGAPVEPPNIGPVRFGRINLNRRKPVTRRWINPRRIHDHRAAGQDGKRVAVRCPAGQIAQADHFVSHGPSKCLEPVRILSHSDHNQH